MLLEAATLLRTPSPPAVAATDGALAARARGPAPTSAASTPRRSTIQSLLDHSASTRAAAASPDGEPGARRRRLDEAGTSASPRSIEIASPLSNAAFEPALPLNQDSLLLHGEPWQPPPAAPQAPDRTGPDEATPAADSVLEKGWAMLKQVVNNPSTMAPSDIYYLLLQQNAKLPGKECLDDQELLALVRSGGKLTDKTAHRIRTRFEAHQQDLAAAASRRQSSDRPG